MPNVLTITVEGSADLLDAGIYGAGAVVRIQSATSEAGTYADISGTGSTPTLAIVAGTAGYPGRDPNGTTATWYRTRYESSGGARVSDWSEPFQVAAPSPTATGRYATLANVKLRLGRTDAADDGILQRYCNFVGSRIEGITGRILAPIPPFATTTSGAIAAGASTFTLATTTDLNPGDALMLGPVSGTHEHVIVSDVSGSTVTPEAPVVNAYGSGATAQRCYIFDGEPSWGGFGPQTLVMPVPNGIISLSSLEVAPTWNAASTSWALTPATDRLLRPSPLDREPGWPATQIHLSPIPSASNTYPYFAGYAAVARAVGTFGWPAIPDEIVDCAETVVIRAFQARRTGQGDMVGTTDTGQVLISRMLAAEWRDVLGRYQSKDVLII